MIVAFFTADLEEAKWANNLDKFLEVFVFLFPSV